MSQRKPKHIRNPQRGAQRTRDGRQCLALPLFVQTLRKKRRVDECRRGRRTKCVQELLVLGAKRRVAAVDRDDRHEAVSHREGNREHVHDVTCRGCSGTTHARGARNLAERTKRCGRAVERRLGAVPPMQNGFRTAGLVWSANDDAGAREHARGLARQLAFHFRAVERSRKRNAHLVQELQALGPALRERDEPVALADESVDERGLRPGQVTKQLTQPWVERMWSAGRRRAGVRVFDHAVVARDAPEAPGATYRALNGGSIAVSQRHL